MRTLHADLTTAQKSIINTPYITITFENGYGGGTSYTYATTDSPNRIKGIRHSEEPYSSHAIVVLDNYDRSLPDLFGYFCTISYGYETVSGNKSSDTAPLWVKQQVHSSKMGSLDTILYLEGQWNLLAEMQDIGSLVGAPSPPYYEIDYTGAAYSIFDIIEQIITSAGFSMIALGGEDDSIIDTLQPDFVVNTIPFENAASVNYRLLNMTKVFCRAEASGAGAFRILYPSGYSGYDYEYTSAKES